MDERSASDLYAVLGVARDAPAREIRRAYRRLARQHHPDLNHQGAEHFTRLAHAYEILNDPARRAGYDRTLPVVAAPAPKITHRPTAPGAAGMRHGTVELSPAEASHLARYPLALHDAAGHTLVLPAGTGHGDQVVASYGIATVVLTVRTH